MILTGITSLIGLAVLIVCLIWTVRAIRSARVVKKFVTYIHHSHMPAVWVRDDLRGLHRDHCLCYDCIKFHPGSAGNCKIAQAVFQNCVKHNIVTPMWECQEFGQDPYAADRKHNQ